MRSTAALFALSTLVSSVLGATYPLKDKFVGEDFFTGFSHQAIADPTHGRVNYVDQATAKAQNLSFASDTSFIMRADSFTVLDANGPGRNSVRIQSNNKYATHVSVYDIRHMPQGCGTWPAAWEVSENWPTEGEVDILEGTNDIEPNQSTLHTSANCAMPHERSMTGVSVSDNCDVAANGNAGCGVQSTIPKSYGKSFNAANGGFYAMERTPTFIKVWFWSRDDPAVPADVKTPGAAVNTDAFGTPAALFVNDACDIATHFAAHNIVINLTFCGDWAGIPQFFNTLGGCPGVCSDFVNANPAAFADAFWDIAGIHVYE
ncbi:2 beta-glucan [Epithele typhae]|uniref:2 beta-glucan n=1 Tax=Epithele typhae TaxID=378194 RepID=UPI00200800A9|nr:2 beta-glucan [Epithele typhae]KAH9927491.1 2 beta-glucan [Epithele typhae]